MAKLGETWHDWCGYCYGGTYICTNENPVEWSPYSGFHWSTLAEAIKLRMNDRITSSEFDLAIKQFDLGVIPES